MSTDYEQEYIDADDRITRAAEERTEEEQERRVSLLSEGKRAKIVWYGGSPSEEWGRWQGGPDWGKMVTAQATYTTANFWNVTLIMGYGRALGHVEIQEED